MVAILMMTIRTDAQSHIVRPWFHMAELWGEHLFENRNTTDNSNLSIDMALVSGNASKMQVHCSI